MPAAAPTPKELPLRPLRPGRAAVAALVALGLLTGIGCPAQAAVRASVLATVGGRLGPPMPLESPAQRIARLRSQAAKVQHTIDQMNNQVEVLVERYNANREALARTRTAQASTQHRIDLARRALSGAKQQLDQRVWAIYTGGSPFSALVGLLGATDLHEVLATAKYQEGVVQSDSSTLARIEHAKRALDALAAQIAAQRRAQESLQVELQRESCICERDPRREPIDRCRPGGRLRHEPARQAVRVGSDRPGQLRLLGPHADRLPLRRPGDPAGLVRPVERRPARQHGRASSRGSGLLRHQPVRPGHHPSRGHVHRARSDGGGAVHRRERARQLDRPGRLHRRYPADRITDRAGWDGFASPPARLPGSKTPGIRCPTAIHMSMSQVGSGLPRLLAQRYELVEQLASGSMTSVWRGHDRVLGRDVVVKVLHPELAADPRLRSRFHQEAVNAARLTHPNIVALYDTGEQEGVNYIVMELVDGPTLRDVLNSQGPLPPAKAARLASEVVHALEYAHQAGVIHRNLKPANILFCDDGSVKVADFSIAKAATGDDPGGTGELLAAGGYI